MRWAKQQAVILKRRNWYGFQSAAGARCVALFARWLIFWIGSLLVSRCGMPNVSPSITNGVTPIAATEYDRGELAQTSIVIAMFLMNNLPKRVCSVDRGRGGASVIAVVDDQRARPAVFPDHHRRWRNACQFSVVASENLPAAVVHRLTATDDLRTASEIMLADDGQTVIDASNRIGADGYSATQPPSASIAYVVCGR
jgi:hypothetical protein